MEHIKQTKQSLLAILAIAIVVQVHSQTINADIVIYGGTASGVIAAVQAARMNKHVVLIEEGKHVGGMVSGGLGFTDYGQRGTVSGITREFYQMAYHYYNNPANWQYSSLKEYLTTKDGKYCNGPGMFFGLEPHVAEKLFNDMLAESGVKVIYGERLDLKNGVQKQGNIIKSIQMESGRTFVAKEFIDATYEGDLMAKAGVSYTVGREPNSQYGEQWNGVQTDRIKLKVGPVDPYVKPGDPSSGVLPNVTTELPPPDGTGDKRVMAYTYRLCFSLVKTNSVPFEKPQSYDANQFEILLRYFAAGAKGFPLKPSLLPNLKTDTNNKGCFSLDYDGMSDAYAEADYATREKIQRAHKLYEQGLLWTLANNPRVPEKIRQAMRQYGLAKDEFVDNGNWPYQLYVREARRMIGAYVVTEDDIIKKRLPNDPVALGAYDMDSHHTRRFVDADGQLRSEGGMFHSSNGPYGISYSALTPKIDQCANLLVPVCLSASHLAYCSIRMEPTYMMLGQAAGTAASLAIDDSVAVQNVPYDQLQNRLLTDKQLIAWTKK